MSKAIKRRRGTTLQHSTFAGLIGELTVDTDKNVVVVHDGITDGGHPTAKDSEVVHNTGNETISGTKTFSSTITGSISGNANTAIHLKNPVTIANVPFNGNTSISIPFGNLSEKPDSIIDYGITDAYTIVEIDNLLHNKANIASTLGGFGITDAYTKDQVNTAISLATPTFNSLLNKPNTISGYGIIDAYTKTETNQAISNLVNSAPQTLDTLNELSVALGNDPNFATTVATQIGTKQNANTAITTTNIGSQSVNYATSAGNADTLDGYHASSLLATVTTSSNGLMISTDKSKLDTVGTNGNGNKTISSSTPSGGSNGDIWYRI